MLLVLSLVGLLVLIARGLLVTGRLSQVSFPEPMLLRPALRSSLKNKHKKGKSGGSSATSATNAGKMRVVEKPPRHVHFEKDDRQREKQKLQKQILDEIFMCLLNGLVDGCYDEVTITCVVFCLCSFSLFFPIEVIVHFLFQVSNVI